MVREARELAKITRTSWSDTHDQDGLKATRTLSQEGIRPM